MFTESQDHALMISCFVHDLAAQRRYGSARLSYVLCAFLLCGGWVVAETTLMGCERPSMGHVELAKWDQSDGRHLDVIREVGVGAAIAVDICYADVTVRAGKDNLLKMVVDFDNGVPKMAPVGYLQEMNVQSQAVSIKLPLPERPRAKVILVIPATTSSLQLKLGRGDLKFDADGTAGERKIKLLSGHIDILASPDSYLTLQAHVSKAKLYDRQSAGEKAHKKKAHKLTSKLITGTGQGSIEIEVVRGRVDLWAAD